ncbi:hypothetical protein RHMOL_Rhmol07G0229600 [Rhododendron molle]|uniref:Uncharacterized protein n=1 Tax=Rhododendron molle TaxID=49168 RepID=A0ACC0N4U4_RHOML|nr:hypothetical protein RHMOL_Rhmol07G0229600 [Rhododendron molle]
MACTLKSMACAPPEKRRKVSYMVLWLVCERGGRGLKQRRRIEGTDGLSNLDLLLLVLAALGKVYFEQIFPDIIRNCSHQKASVRDGYLTLFKYLPRSLGIQFKNYLQQVLPAILDGLADENESVREAALSAGHVLVEHYATTSLPLLLPAVEDGIFSDSWRVRQSSVELLGDLLFKVAGTSGKALLEGGSDDEGASTEAQGRAIIEVLGREKRNEVLTALYMVRTDVSITVRQVAGRSLGSKEKLEWEIRYKIALGTAEGLSYLHEGCQRRIIHTDIKAANILLREDFEPQVKEGRAVSFQKTQGRFLFVSETSGEAERNGWKPCRGDPKPSPGLAGCLLGDTLEPRPDRRFYSHFSSSHYLLTTFGLPIPLTIGHHVRPSTSVGAKSSSHPHGNNNRGHDDDRDVSRTVIKDNDEEHVKVPAHLPNGYKTLM